MGEPIQDIRPLGVPEGAGQDCPPGRGTLVQGRNRLIASLVGAVLAAIAVQAFSHSLSQLHALAVERFLSLLGCFSARDGVSIYTRFSSISVRISDTGFFWSLALGWFCVCSSRSSWSGRVFLAIVIVIGCWAFHVSVTGTELMLLSAHLHDRIWIVDVLSQATFWSVVVVLLLKWTTLYVVPPSPSPTVNTGKTP
jgi:hypothetical protein